MNLSRRGVLGLLAGAVAGRRSLVTIAEPPFITADTPFLILEEEMSLAEFERRYITAAVKAIGNAVDAFVMNPFDGVPTRGTLRCDPGYPRAVLFPRAGSKG